jgi:hypothetical protein
VSIHDRWAKWAIWTRRGGLSWLLLAHLAHLGGNNVANTEVENAPARAFNITAHGEPALLAGDHKPSFPEPPMERVFGDGEFLPLITGEALDDHMGDVRFEE